VTNQDKASGKPHGEYGDGTSPVIAGDLVIVQLTSNANAAAWFAFNRKDGQPVWSFPIDKRQVKDETADRAYSPAAPFVFKGKPHLLLISNDAIDGVDATTGVRAWTYPTSGLQMQYGPFPEPFFFDKDKFFLEMWYSEKANGAAFKITDAGLSPLWGNNAIGKGAYSCVVRDGCLYGFGVKGLNCVDLKDGTVKWKWRSSEPATTKDQGEIILVGDKLVWLSSSGTLYVGEASPDKTKPIASFKAVPRCTKDLRKDKAQYNNVISTSPALAGGRLYCRSSWGDLVCVDVR